jgi:outer membrane protein, heavy metal efflux system
MRARFLAAAAVFAAAPALAGQLPPLTLDDAVREGLARNIDLTAERDAVAPLRHRPDQARYLPPPMLEAQIWRWPVTTLNPADVDMYMFMGKQPLPARGARAAEATLARRETDVAEASVAVRERDIVEAITRAYVDLLVARRARGVFDETLSTLRQLSDVSLARYGTTTLGQQDVLKAIVELSQLHQEFIDLDEATRRAEIRLATLLGRDPATRIGPLEEPPPVPAALDAGVLVQLATEQVPELRRAAADTAAAAAALEVARVARRPEYVVGGGYMLMPGEAGAWSASFGVSWPNAPWSRGRLAALEAERAAAVGAAGARTAQIRQAVVASVHDALATYEGAQQRAALLRTTVIPQARQVFDIARVGYAAGRVEFLTVLDSQRAQLTAELEAIRAEGGVLGAVAAIERAVGARLTTPDTVAALAAAREQ